MTTDENVFEVACLFYEICGTFQVFYSVEEYDIYGDDYVCPECALLNQDCGDSFPMSLEYDEGE